MSICSQPSIDWVSKKVEGLNFQESATRFMRDMTRRLKLAKKIASQRALEPDAETALRYSQCKLS